MTLDKNIILLDTVFLQEVDDETILLDTKTEEYFSLNEIGTIFYQIFKDEPNLAQVLNILEKEFDVPLEQLKSDLLTFVETLEKKGLVTLT